MVGNLPYNISTPILFHLLGVADVVQDQHFMLQKEVIDRMVGRPCTADYGAIGGVQAVNCRLAASQLDPAETLRHLEQERDRSPSSPSEEVRYISNDAELMDFGFIQSDFF